MANFAVIKTGGKQYKIEEGTKLKIEKIKGDYKVGDKLTFAEVLLTSNGDDLQIGAPIVSGGEVEAEIVGIGKNKTVEVVKYMPKSRYYKRNGHRQPHFEVKITSLGGKKKESKAKAKKEEE